MMFKLLGVGVALATVSGLVGVSLRTRSDTPSVASGGGAAVASTGDLARAVEYTPESPDGWKVTQANSAHGAMVVEVEAGRLDQAMDIARQVVEPMRSRGYTEVLVYVRFAGGDEGAVRRVQWTLGGGYTETGYSEQ